MKNTKIIGKIVAHMEEKGVKHTWLCKRVEVSNGHLSNVFKGVRSLTPELLSKINKALGTDFSMPATLNK